MPKKTSNSNYKRLEILGVLLCAVSLFIIVSLLGHDPSEELAISPNATNNSINTNRFSRASCACN